MNLSQANTQKKSRRELPSFYYLDHFHALLSSVVQSSAHLLRPTDQGWLENFHNLDQFLQATFIRIFNRKQEWVRVTKLRYSELPNLHEHINQLEGIGWLTSGTTIKKLGNLLALTLSALTKDEIHNVLSVLLRPENIKILKSYSKTELFDLASRYLTQTHIDDNLNFIKKLGNKFVKVSHETPYYLKFLYFGELKSDLNAYALRDLGLRKTRHQQSHSQSRFDNLGEAESAFTYACAQENLNKPWCSDGEAYMDSLPSPKGEQAKEIKDLLYLKLGTSQLKKDKLKALTLFNHSQHPKALEQTIRITFALGKHADAKALLLDKMKEPHCESFLLFAEDFYQRKYHGKKTTQWTDILRSAHDTVHLDECYKGFAEQGVKAFHQRHGRIAYKTENKLWKAIFALTFWNELFEDQDCAPANEFDAMPRVLREGRFYRLKMQAIEDRLDSLASIESHQTLIVKTIAKTYGQRNGLVRWHPKMLEILMCFLRLAPRKAVIKQLRTMSQMKSNQLDGFPDLMVSDDKQLWFEEVKAPGDQLRKNQLLTIKRLQNAGFHVKLNRVKWQFNKKQIYAVVDIETTGGNASNGRVIEIGIVKVMNNEIIASWQTLINPQRRVNKVITSLTGITQEMVSDKPIFSEVLEEVRDILDGCVFVAHNVNFDFGFIKEEFIRCGKSLSMPKLCTVRESKKAFPGLLSYGLKSLSQHFKIDLKHHHRALADATAAAHLLIKVFRHRLNHKDANESIADTCQNI